MRPGPLTLQGVQVLCAALVATALACGWLSRSLWSDLASFRAHMNALRSQPAASAPAVASSPVADFTAHWPVGRVDDVVLDQALGDAQRVGVRVLAASASLHPDSRELVQQFQFTFEVRGTYVAVKAWLNEVTARRGGPIIETLEVRRAEAGNASVSQQEVTAAVRLRLFMRPKGAR